MTDQQDALAAALHEATCPRHAGSSVPHLSGWRGYEPCHQQAKAILATPEGQRIAERYAVGEALERFIETLDPNDQDADFEFRRWGTPTWQVFSFGRVGRGGSIPEAVAEATR